MELAKGVSCLIPFYNEGDRIIPVLETVTRAAGINQVVCVDDGSADDTFRRIREDWPGVELIRLPENEGKAGAIRHGLEKVRNEWVLLMDADLQDVDRYELEDLLMAAHYHDDVDMIILRRINAAWFVKLNRGDVLLSGERLIRKNDLQEILRTDVYGFQLELAINQYMQLHGKIVRWLPWSATNTYKMDKRGPIEGFIKDFQMYANIVQYVGFASVIRQVATFGRKPLKWNY